MVDFMSMGCLLLSLLAIVLSIVSIVKVNSNAEKFGESGLPVINIPPSLTCDPDLQISTCPDSSYVCKALPRNQHNIPGKCVPATTK